MKARFLSVLTAMASHVSLGYKNQIMYDVVIIGGGPAGVGASVYAARKKLKALLVAESFGGQSIVSADVQNWIGEKSIAGVELARKLEEHARAYEPDLEIWMGDRVEKVERSLASVGTFVLTTKKGKTIETKTMLLCTGSGRKRLGVPGEDRLDGKGVAWCSICDAPLFGGKDVAVIGGGNAGLEAVIDLNAYANTMYLLHRGPALRGDPITQEKIKAMPKVSIIYNAVTQEIVGDSFVSGVRYKNVVGGEEKTLAVQGVFIEVGSIPNSGLVKDVVSIDIYGYIIVDPATQRTSELGIWAAGDVTNTLYRQNNIAVGDAIHALLNIYSYLYH